MPLPCPLKVFVHMSLTVRLLPRQPLLADVPLWHGDHRESLVWEVLTGGCFVQERALELKVDQVERTDYSYFTRIPHGTLCKTPS